MIVNDSWNYHQLSWPFERALSLSFHDLLLIFLFCFFFIFFVCFLLTCYTLPTRKITSIYRYSSVSSAELAWFLVLLLLVSSAELAWFLVLLSLVSSAELAWFLVLLSLVSSAELAWFLVLLLLVSSAELARFLAVFSLLSVTLVDILLVSLAQACLVLV